MKPLDKNTRMLLLSSIFTVTALLVGVQIFMPRSLTHARPSTVSSATSECKGLLVDFLKAGNLSDKIKMEQIGIRYLDQNCRVGGLLAVMHYIKSRDHLSQSDML